MSSYPEDLIPVIRNACSRMRGRKHRKAPPLPTNDVLRVLLDTSYHASFEKEESRRPGFRLMLCSPADYEKTYSETEKRGIYGSRNFRLIPLDKERLFELAEVNRLAPAAEMTRLIICVHCPEPQPPVLRIWALLDVGENWWKFLHHEADSGMPPPNFLTISSTGPGEISVSAQGELIAFLKGGRITIPSLGALWKGPLSGFLAGARKQLYTHVTEALGTKEWDIQDDDFPQRFYNFFLERLLFHTRRLRHGGTIILVTNQLTKDDTRLADRVNIKYPCRYDIVWNLLVKSLVNHHQFYDLYFPLWDGKQTLTQKAFRDFHMLEEERRELDEALSDAAQAIASLTSVDGAVIVNERFGVLGFGAEVVAPSPSLSQIKLITSGDSHIAVPVESFGTRHRSAFRFCSSLEESIAFVLPQDGGVKAVKRHGKEVYLWPNISGAGLGI